jgi:glycosyltransferase involved in cell wall biosynthesis
MLFNGAYVLWEDPLIVSCQGEAELSSVLQLRRPASILLSPTWLWTIKSLPRLFLYRRDAQRSRKALHFMCNEPGSHTLLRRFGLAGDLVSINAYVNEHVFCVTNEPKKYDAVYAARMVTYKRLHLAAKIPRLVVQTYGECRTPDGAYDLPRYAPALQHAQYNRNWQSVEQVVAIYNQASVGLALSKCEGAMLASVEYMLCGLPQVSTRCRGGRELFFDPRYVKIVRPTAKAVATAVNEMILRKVDPHLVREETLKKLQVHRLRLCNYITDIIRQLGASAPSYDRVYDRLLGHESGINRCFVHFRDYAKFGLV